MTNFNNVIRSLLAFDGDGALTRALDEILTKFHADTGSIHVLDGARGLLVMKASRNLPPPVVAITREIPLGKGIAGEAAQTAKPVTMCNLQTDSSGVAKPGAKQTGVGGALCVPMMRDGKVWGTLGIGTRREYTFTAEETQMLASVGKVIAEELTARATA